MVPRGPIFLFIGTRRRAKKWQLIESIYETENDKRARDKESYAMAWWLPTGHRVLALKKIKLFPFGWT